MNEKKNYKCLKCDKEFVHRQSLFKHTKNCGKLQVENFLVVGMFMNINQFLKELLQN